MFLVLKRIVSLRRFFWVPTTYVLVENKKVKFSISTFNLSPDPKSQIWHNHYNTDTWIECEGTIKAILENPKADDDQNLGPSIRGLVTDIQVYVYIGICCRGPAFKTDECWSLNSHYLHYFSVYLWFFLKKQWLKILSDSKRLLLYLLKVCSSLWTSARNQGTLFSYFQHF